VEVTGFLSSKETTPSESSSHGEDEEVTTLYEHAGGEEALHRLEEIFYSKVLSDPILKAVFTERMPHHVEHLTWFTAESFGGPDRFTRELGFEHIIEIHRGLRITDEQRDRFATVYMESLDEAGLPDDAAFREAVRSHVEFGVQVAQQNSWAETDDQLHPIRAVPRWKWPS
jgi:hemoglobin